MSLTLRVAVLSYQDQRGLRGSQSRLTSGAVHAAEDSRRRGQGRLPPPPPSPPTPPPPHCGKGTYMALLIMGPTARFRELCHEVKGIETSKSDPPFP